MPPRSAEEKARRKLLHKQKLEARKLKKQQEENQKNSKKKANDEDSYETKEGTCSGEGGDGSMKTRATKTTTSLTSNDRFSFGKKEGECRGCGLLVGVPADAFHNILNYLPARDLGAFSMTCRYINLSMNDGRVHHLFSRLSYATGTGTGMGAEDANNSNNGAGKLRVPIRICESENEVKDILVQALEGCGDTGRVVTKKEKKGHGSDEYIAFARFIEEAVLGRSVQKFPGQKPSFLPPVVNGRFASASPEHSLCRAGGGDRSGAGGSGTASWGVGKRGQLGHGKRRDEKNPQLLLGGIGYGIRIVQVSAGGGLVRVAHSLLLTSTGQVLSFGCAQYGQLGHGYSSGKQLPDTLRPQYIKELAHLRCTCVSAGELHSAVVTSDGDLYTWGDAFCGQLGLGDKRPQLLPKQVTEGGLEDECVLSVSCGARHTLCVTEDGEVFSFGLGHFGVLGRSYTPYEYHSAQALSNLGIDIEGVEQPQQLGHIEQIDNEMRTHLDLLANLTLDDNSDQCIPKVIDSLVGISIVGASAGHRHSMFLDSFGGVYTCGSGFGPRGKQDIPMKVMELVHKNVQVMQISAGVDISMVVSTTGDVYSWGKTQGGRIGIDTADEMIRSPMKVTLKDSNGKAIKAVDVECGYVHSMIVGCDGSLYMCGGVGTDGDDDGQNQEELSDGNTPGEPYQVQDFNIWHRVREPKEEKQKTKWKKYGKYELQGRSKAMAEADKWNS